jgi:hypothetical protein
MNFALPPNLLIIVAGYYPELIQAACAAGDPILTQQLWNLGLASNAPYRALGAACAAGHLEISAWVWKQGLTLAGLRADIREAIIPICEQGRIGSFKWLWGLGLVRADLLYIDALSIACRFGHLDLAQWLCAGSYVYEKYLDLLEAACGSGLPDVVAWALKRYEHNITTRCLEGPLMIACRQGYMPVLKVLADHGARIDAVCNSNLFREACEKGHTDIAQWLWERAGCDLAHRKTMAEKAFVAACKGGHLQTAQWLYGIRPPRKQKGTEWKRQALLRACGAGHLSVVVWLWNSGMSLADVRADSVAALRLACAGGHVAIAQFLWGLGLTLGDLRGEIHGMMATMLSLRDPAVAAWAVGVGFQFDHTNTYIIERAFLIGSLPVLEWMIAMGTTRAFMRHVTAGDHLPRDVVVFIGESDSAEVVCHPMEI